MASLGSQYPGSTHVEDIGLLGASDQRIWEYARANNFAITSKDTDFRERSVLEGFRPKVIWLEVGNAGTAAIAAMLIEERPRVLGFDQDENSSMLILTLGVNAV